MKQRLLVETRITTSAAFLLTMFALFSDEVLSIVCYCDLFVVHLSQLEMLKTISLFLCSTYPCRTDQTELSSGRSQLVLTFAHFYLTLFTQTHNYINLRCNLIRHEGIRYLADALPLNAVNIILYLSRSLL